MIEKMYVQLSLHINFLTVLLLVRMVYCMRVYAGGNNIFVSAAVCVGTGIWVTIACAVVLKKVDVTFIRPKVGGLMDKILE